MKTALTPALVRRYDRPGPRYTSYPTAAEFHEGVGAEALAERLTAAARRADEPLGLYVHLPFCTERCHYCGCNVVITKKHDVACGYLAALQTEIRATAERLGERRRVRQLHWGGGTPTYYTPEELRALQTTTLDLFELEDDAEVAIEIDPRVTTFEHLAMLRDVGFNRLSLGIQDFTPAVQEAVHRVQSFEATRELIAEARRLGFGSVNVDLIYGLPKQTPEDYARAIGQVLEIRPERVAVYSYAHMPWIKPHQKRIDAADLPTPGTKLELFTTAFDGFQAAGYDAIGMDHFALPEDELGRALAAGTLWRNFMGYTVRHAPDSIAFGMSAIADVDGAFVQNERKLSRYQEAVRAGRLPAERGYVLSADDKLRRHVITALMCTFQLDLADVERRFGIVFHDVFAKEWEALAPLEADGFLRRSEGRIDVVGIGRLFVRNICMVFDAYLEGHVGSSADGASPGDGKGGDRPRFSRTV